jgi:hypothetical protein
MVKKQTEILYLASPKRRGKKPERKRKNLIRLGKDQGQAYAWSRTRMGGWAVAQSPILGTTITIERLKKRGYISLVEYYKR